MERFETTRLSERLTRISGVTREMMYLAEGERRAALIDTGIGVGDLRGLVARLTDRPVDVFLTHGHMDHAMGSGAFSRVYLNPEDETVMREHCKDADRKEYIRSFLGERMEEIGAEEYRRQTGAPCLALREGDRFDLGGLTLEFFGAAGHTPGSMAVLLEEEKTLILGDACNPMTFLFADHSTTVRQYLENLQRLDGRTKGRYERVFLSHRSGEAPVDMIESVMRVCEDILEGDTDDLPYDFMGQRAYIAKRTDASGRTANGRVGNIVYRKDKVW